MAPGEGCSQLSEQQLRLGKELGGVLELLAELAAAALAFDALVGPFVEGLSKKKPAVPS